MQYDTTCSEVDKTYILLLKQQAKGRRPLVQYIFESFKEGNLTGLKTLNFCFC